MKTLAGGLLCIIPHPVTWEIGATLMEKKLKNLPPPAQYNDPKKYGSEIF